MNLFLFKILKCRINSFDYRILLTMRIAIILLFGVLLNLKAEILHSQITVNITLHMNHSPVEKVLMAIEQQSGLYTVYNGKIVDVDRLVSISVDKQPINSVLKELFKNTDVQYEIKGKHIILTVPHKVVDVSKHTITGFVKDASGEPVIGANITIKGHATHGTITDIDGKFQIEVPSNAILCVSFIGYLPMEIDTKGKTNLNIVLHEDTQTLEEVVVVGFGSQKKVNLTGAVSAVSMDKVLGERPVTNITSALQGAVPGLTFSTDGNAGGLQPGVGKKINIRGMASINGDGSPLILIDNVVAENG